MKRNFKATIILLALAALLCAGVFAGCDNYSKSDKEYWFSSYETRFVAYDETANEGNGNLDEAGNYWEMTVKNDCEISIYISNDSSSMFSTTYFYVNDSQVQSDSDPIFSFAYKNLTLKKGDKLKLHAFWTNGIMTNETGFTMSMFCVDDGTGNYVIENI